jgi:hypothetical protein
LELREITDLAVFPEKAGVGGSTPSRGTIPVAFPDRIAQLVEGIELDAATSAAVFHRLGRIQRLDVVYTLA